MERVRAFLEPRGLTLWTLPLKVEYPSAVLEWAAEFNADDRYILCGGTRWPDINHAVICRGGRIEWNPWPAVRILGPCYPDRIAYEVGILGKRL